MILVLMMLPLMLAFERILAKLDLPAGGQLVQQLLEYGLFLSGKGLKQDVVLHFGPLGKASAPVELTAQAARPFAAALFVLLLVLQAKIFTPFAAPWGVGWAVIAALGTSLSLSAFRFLLHVKNSSAFYSGAF